MWYCNGNLIFISCFQVILIIKAIKCYAGQDNLTMSQFERTQKNNWCILKGTLWKFLWHNHTYWVRSKHPSSLIELQGVACLWMADAGSKLKASLLSEMVNVSKEDLLNPWGSVLTPMRKSRQLEWIVLFLSSLCMQMCSEGESASWETQQDLPQKKPWEEQNEGILKTCT